MPKGCFLTNTYQQEVDLQVDGFELFPLTVSIYRKCESHNKGRPITKEEEGHSYVTVMES